MHLNEDLRARLRSLADEADEGRQGLSSETIDRIAAATAEFDARERRKQRSLRIAAASITAIAAAALVYARVRTGDSEHAVAHHAPTPPRCASLSLAPVTWRSGSDAARFAIDERARVDVAAASDVSASASSSCASEILLTRGSVAVWARDLAGGTLAVQAGDVRVIVHGTVFEVRAEADGARYVAVREGRVEVVRDGVSHWLGAGDALRVSASGATSTTTVDSIATERLQGVLADVRSSVAAPPTDVAVAEPTPTLEARPEPLLDPAAALREAEAAYRAGRIDEARRAFRRVGATRGTLAEAAWIRLGRLETQAGRTAEAARALAEHRRRFPSGSLAAEARVAEARALRSLGRAAEASTLEAWVVENRPDSPYAQAIRDRRP